MTKPMLAFAGFFTFIAASAFAAANFWQPLKFTIDASAIHAGLLDLQKANDPVYAEMFSREPGFEAAFAKSFPESFDFLTNQYFAPQALWDSEKNEGVSELQALLSMSRPDWSNYPTMAGMLHSTQTSLIPPHLRKLKTKETYGYRFCEKFPTDANCPTSSYGDWEPDQLSRRLSRRLVSTPGFVDAVCPSIIPIVKWHLEWSRLAAVISNNDVDSRLTDSFNRVDEFLSEVYGNGTWSSAAMKSIDSYDKTKMFIYRRYLDGGPELIKSYQNCLHLIRTELRVPMSVAANPEGGILFQEMLHFRELPFPKSPNVKLIVQTEKFTKFSLARIIRLIEDPNATGTIRDWAYRDQNTFGEMIALSSWMSKVDSHYNYRIITKDELTEVMPAALAGSCTVNKNYFLYGLKDLELQGDDCTLLMPVLVRDNK